MCVIERWLFRGRVKDDPYGFWDDGDWITGHISTMKEDFVCIKPIEANQTFYEISVDPKTIGQCVGASNNRGMSLFEGDILYVSNENWFKSCGVVVYSELRFRWEYDSILQGNSFPLDSVLYNFDNCIEVVGNIHDNPELLKLTYDNIEHERFAK